MQEKVTNYSLSHQLHALESVLPDWVILKDYDTPDQFPPWEDVSSLDCSGIKTMKMDKNTKNITARELKPPPVTVEQFKDWYSRRVGGQPKVPDETIAKALEIGNRKAEEEALHRAEAKQGREK